MPLVQEIFNIAAQRSVVLVEGLTEVQTELLKLPGDCVVLAFTQAGEKEPRLYVHAELATVDGTSFISDATVVRRGETAAQFYAHNEEFFRFEPDVVRFTRATKTGVGLTTVGSGTERGQRMTSRDRAVGHLNCWARYFGEHRKDQARAMDFLVLSLAKQTGALREHARDPDLAQLKLTVDFYTDGLPLGLLTPGAVREQARATCREYLEAMVRARQKLAIFHPEAQAAPLAQVQKLLEAFSAP